MGATLRAPIASPSQMLGSIGAAVNPDVQADVLASEAGTEARLTQPPHPSLIVDVPSGYPEDLETFGTPDTVDVADIFLVFSTSCPDMSVAASMSLDFDDRAREIQNPSTVHVICRNGRRLLFFPKSFIEMHQI